MVITITIIFITKIVYIMTQCLREFKPVCIKYEHNIIKPNRRGIYDSIE